ncbi:hypothetical protein B0A48_09745 [Cryoendolithus antarcticus]|uniref:ABC transporter domain-containing protein n=1 Tax=Cryoendolithus antarcticus TaxID=1507870 RepID=A0A1V8T2K3_9PEZI|nr:hypothetical protein B0A48_09745 [Cryoendolithus antarcticus]
MPFSTPTLGALALFVLPYAVADFLTPTYPYPSDLTSHTSLVRAAWDNATDTFEHYFKDGVNTTATVGILGTENVTFSFGLFSLEDQLAASELQYHRAGPQTVAALNGTISVDGDSIYRIASVSKLITTFAGQIALNTTVWYQPITEILPEFAAVNANRSAIAPDWSTITPHDLASHLSGIEATGPIEDLLVSVFTDLQTKNTSVYNVAAEAGLDPNYNPVALAQVTLGLNLSATPEEIAVACGSAPPVFLSKTTPAYSNLGFMLLGLIVQRISGKGLEEVYNDLVFTPLGMNGSFVNAPLASPYLDRSVIVGPLTASWAYPVDAYTIPSGGLLSTINDLNKLGVGLMNSTLLPRDQTRGWMKPVASLASLSYNIGAPWEIIRYVHNDTGKVTDIYTKLGDSGSYGGMLALIPDYNAGFSFLNGQYEPLTGPQTRGKSALKLIDHVAAAIIPALEAQAAAEAVKKVVGQYTSSTVNSTVGIAFNETTIPNASPSLNINSWISNGIDMLALYYESEKPRLLVTVPKFEAGCGEIVFQIAQQEQFPTYQAAGFGPFSGIYYSTFDWATFDGDRFLGGSLRTWRVHVDEQGVATQISNDGIRASLVKEVNYPSSTDLHNHALFAGLNFILSSGSAQQHWSVISPSSVARTTFLQILAGQHICHPPTARRYPHLSDIGTSPQHAVKYVGFDAERGNNVGGTSVRGAYLSARYESRREETDFTVKDYLTGHTELNALERVEDPVDQAALARVTDQLDLGRLLSMPVANLSNGQTRRARIAKALIDRPQVLLLDGPFMGLDPNTLARLSEVLRELAESGQPKVVISFRPEDSVPHWINYTVMVDNGLRVVKQGETKSVLKPGTSALQPVQQLSRDGFSTQLPSPPLEEAVIEMTGVRVSYGPKTVLGDWHRPESPGSGLHWSLHRGQRAGIFGPNGSGKTTMLSLITSDHPQAYSLPIKLFGRSRLPEKGEKGISVFDLQQRMGHSSPEVHAFFPRQITVKRALESAWADAPLAKPKLSEDAKNRVAATLRWFTRELSPKADDAPLIEKLKRSSVAEAETLLVSAQVNESDLAWAKETRFGELPFSSQRLLLFLRAIVASPELVILDEAFSGMDETVRDKALLFLSQGEKVSEVTNGTAHESMLSKLGKFTMTGLTDRQALLVISHAKEDVPGCVREWICLPEAGEGREPRTGTLAGPLQLNPKGWDKIWGRS